MLNGFGGAASCGEPCCLVRNLLHLGRNLRGRCLPEPRINVNGLREPTQAPLGGVAITTLGS